jgi:putative hydrolase of the HAD superfamily
VADRLVLWDFDGTLAWRAGMWSGAVMEVLDEHESGHGVVIGRIREGLRNGYPWDSWRQPHPHLCEPGRWWALAQERIALALVRAGIAAPRAAELAESVRERYLDVTIGWQLFEDTLPALRALREQGWRNVVLSNHVPELAELVGGLGLGPYLDDVYSSARTGYEKPHPEAFRLALAACGHPRRAWMVGDNPHADIGGAEAVGLPAILVRTEGRARHRAAGLEGAVAVIRGGDTDAAPAPSTP